MLGAYGLLHSSFYKTLGLLEILLGQPNTGCETSFHYLQFGSKYDHLHHANMHN